VVSFTKSVINREHGQSPLRENLVSIYGDEAVMEMYLAISVTQLFPTFKWGIGYSETCSNVQLDI